MTNSDTDLIMDLFGYLSIFVMVCVIIGGIIDLVIAHCIHAWFAQKAQRDQNPRVLR